MKTIVSFIVCMIFLSIIGAVVEKLKNRGYNGKENQGSRYVVKVPSALPAVYSVMFGLGFVLFWVFLFFYMEGKAAVTTGHLVFALFFACIGLLVAVFSHHWKIIVDGSKIEVYRFFRLASSLDVSSISRVEIGKKEKLTLYDAKGKRLTTVDALTDNYDRFLKMLKENDKVSEKKK